MGGASWVRVGRVARAVGLRGEVAVAGTEGVLGVARELRLVGEPEDGADAVYRIVASHPQGRYWAVQLDRVSRREQAEALVGRDVEVRREDLGASDEAGWLWADLEGVPVITTGGEPLGRVTGLLETGAVDVVEVTGPRGVVLLPLAPYVRRTEDALVVDPPEGLLELGGGAAARDGVPAGEAGGAGVAAPEEGAKRRG